MVFLFCVFLIISISFVSAGWFSELLKKIFVEPLFSPEASDKETATKGINEIISTGSKPEAGIEAKIDYHKECINQQCGQVEGPGEDECSSNSDCGIECTDSDNG